ncbi:xanthine dehydrogenase molybdopterin binding subunit [Roseicitreum antarcticum]|uniref:Xanthine dehydrogenase, molybdenum binding subunit apoprotein n=1 Tax=Roseicitreum antarcticum TaxID=564137 RepID=A0A1H2ZZK5_9RHOB|nr:molybdopterin cofactor-binding domain-containing protein [Roseicitreum antarcticum]SDX22940.1 xanthine dehydrogenase, molybdenum binding subunit apoprotein [Roseicitreum antarcticum]
MKAMTPETPKAAPNGAALPHDAAALHVAGTARYVDDIPTPRGTLHLAFGLSEVAHGTITGLDLDAVRAAPGVVAVLAAGDLARGADCSPSNHDEPLLADGVVHYLGQPVFVVVADSHLAARKAARLGRISHDPLPAILTMDEALAASSRFEDGPRIWTKGAPDAAIAQAAHQVEGTIEMGGQEHFYLEGQAALALPQEGGDMIIHASTQHPTEIQHKVAEALGLQMHAVRVEVRRMGGGFGGKESQGNALAVACALAAAHTGAPCKMRYDRDDDMMITGKRHDFRIRYRAGMDAMGRVLGITFQHLTRCGWAMDLSLPVADRAMLHADNAYDLPHVRIESHRLRTNTQSATAFRGFGGPQGMLGIERVMDHIAHAVGRDPLEVRRANYYADAANISPAAGGNAAAPLAPAAGGNAPAAGGGTAALLATATGDGRGAEEHTISPPAENAAPAAGGDGGLSAPQRGGDAAPPPPAAPADGPCGQTTPYGMDVTDFILHAMTDDLAAHCEYGVRRAQIRAWNAGNPVLKRGIALTPVKFGISFTLSHLNQAGALVHIYQDGSIHMNHGGTEMGQGLFQKVAQVAAGVFGLEVGAVKITATDTGKVPNTSATAASSGADLNGMAVRIACETLRDRLAAFLMAQHQVDAAAGAGSAVTFSDGRVRVAGADYSFAEVVARAYADRIGLSATGFYRTPDLSWDRLRGKGRPFYYFAYGVACSEVVLDTLTGENRILRTDILHDTGTSLNPALDIGQIEGGFVQGAGWLTMEELVWDASGRLRTHAPSTYKIPACSDRPEVFNVALWNQANLADTVGKSKAVGEPPLMHGISVLMALSDAVAACGDGSRYAALDAPATPERLLAAVARQREGGPDEL